MTRGEYPRKPEPEIVHEKRERPCLSCRRTFTSEWFGNRICDQCKKMERYSSVVSTFSAARRTMRNR